MATVSKRKLNCPKSVLDLHTAHLETLDGKVDKITDKIFNGFPAEIRKEVHKEINAVRGLVVSILVAIVLGLAGIIIEGRISANVATEENMRNYKAIIDLNARMDVLHPDENGGKSR